MQLARDHRLRGANLFQFVHRITNLPRPQNFQDNPPFYATGNRTWGRNRRVGCHPRSPRINRAHTINPGQ